MKENCYQNSVISSGNLSSAERIFLSFDFFRLITQDDTMKELQYWLSKFGIHRGDYRTIRSFIFQTSINSGEPNNGVKQKRASPYHGNSVGEKS